MAASIAEVTSLEPMDRAVQLGLFQETSAYSSRQGSTLQNASHFLN